MSSGQGFVAALDQSGGSTPKALKLYGIEELEYNNSSEMYNLIHEMRTRIIKSSAFNSKRILAAILFENTLLRQIAQIHIEIYNLGNKAREGKLSISDMQRGTFTISNGGVYGSMLSTPILNLPQSGVLGMHNIVSRPYVINNEIKIRPIMYLALSYDHRIIDGKEAVSFLKTVKENLEEPRRLFLNL